MRVVSQGDTVQVRYVKRLQGGSVVPPRGRAFAELTAGVDHRRLPGLGLALVGLSVGESRTQFVPARQAYGAYDAGRVHRLRRARLDGDADLSVGGWVRVWDRRHHRRLVRIVELCGDTAVIDANHRWAGQSMEVEVEVIGISGPEAAADDPEGGPADPERGRREGVWLDDGGQNG
jgi:peptidylprolyl isomerase